VPHELNLDLENKKIKIVHGSPRWLNEYLFEDLSKTELMAIFSEYPCDILICGHTHLPYTRKIDENLVIK
jgi:predicted phosphodiesterase